jgi:uncharacterized protein YukE
MIADTGGGAGGGTIRIPAGSATAVFEYASQLEQSASDLMDLVHDTQQTTSQIRERASWSGAAADAYSRFCDGLTQSLGQMPAVLRVVAAAARDHAEILASAHSQVASASGSADQATGMAAASAHANAQAVNSEAANAVAGRARSGTEKVEESKSELARLWEHTEPVRKALEGVLSPLDIVAADHWIEALDKVAEVPSEWLGEVDKFIEDIGSLRQTGGPAVEALVEAAKETEQIGGKLDAWLAFSPGWLKTAACSLSQIRGLSYTLSGLGVVADLGTMISPQDRGATGWVDRGVAGVNGSLLVANACLDEIPVVGEVTMVGTGVYLAGDYLYNHWKPFHNVCDDIGHGTVTGVKDVGHAVSAGWHSVTSTIGSWF